MGTLTWSPDRFPGVCAHSQVTACCEVTGKSQGQSQFSECPEQVNRPCAPFEGDTVSLPERGLPRLVGGTQGLLCPLPACSSTQPSVPRQSPSQEPPLLHIPAPLFRVLTFLRSLGTGTVGPVSALSSLG